MMSLSGKPLSYLFAVLTVILPRSLLVRFGVKGRDAMFAKVQAQLRMRADLLLAGHLDELARQYRYPMPLHMGRGRVIVRSQDDAQAMLALLRNALLGRGVDAVEPQVVALDLPRSDRIRLWVDWHEIAPDVTRVSSALYYCRLTPSGMQTEMVTYTRLSMPELNSSFAALAMSA